jgi:dCMP deaminase
MGDVDESHTSACQIWQPCETAVHGEANAIAFSARMGIMLQNAKLFTTLSPCYKCSQLIINSGIEEVVYLEEYRKTDGLELLAAAGVGVVRYTHGS